VSSKGDIKLGSLKKKNIKKRILYYYVLLWGHWGVPIGVYPAGDRERGEAK